MVAIIIIKKMFQTHVGIANLCSIELILYFMTNVKVNVNRFNIKLKITKSVFVIKLIIFFSDLMNVFIIIFYIRPNKF